MQDAFGSRRAQSMVNTHDVTEFLFFNHGSLSRTGEALGKMTEEDQRVYRNTLMRLGRAMDINAPADEPIGLEAETLFDELQKMVSRALAT